MSLESQISVLELTSSEKDCMKSAWKVELAFLTRAAAMERANAGESER